MMNNFGPAADFHRTSFRGISLLVGLCVLAVLLAACQGTGMVLPSPTPSALAGQDKAALPTSVYLNLTLFGEEIHGFAVEDDAGKQVVKDAIFNYLLKSAAWPGIDTDAMENRITISITFSKEEGYPTLYHVFDLDGKHCMQAGEGMYSTISDEVYLPLRDLAMGFSLPNALTVRSGSHEIKAMPHMLWSERKADGLNADMRHYTPQQMAPYVQYLELDSDRDGLSPFTPSANGKELFGSYTLYNERFEELQFIQPSGLKPQTYLFRDAPPGRYIVELQVMFETAESKDGYQYFFGVIVPEGYNQ